MEAVKQGLEPEEWIKTYWERYTDPPFHSPVVYPMLEKYYSKLIAGGKPGRVFVPLCGKSVDMVYLADLGHEVVGVEYAKVAVERFFKGNNLSYSESEVENEPFVKYEAKEKKITIYQGNFFHLKPDLIGSFSIVLDIGSFGAVNIPSRKAYVEMIVATLEPGGRILMEISQHHPGNPGPPFHIADESVTEYFGENFQVEILDLLESETPKHFNPAAKFFLRIVFLTMKK